MNKRKIIFLTGVIILTFVSSINFIEYILKNVSSLGEIMDSTNTSSSFIAFQHKVIIYAIILGVLSLIRNIGFTIFGWLAYFQIEKNQRRWRRVILGLGGLNIVFAITALPNVVVSILSLAAGIFLLLVSRKEKQEV